MKRKVFYPGSKVRHSPFKYLILGQGYMSEYSSVLTHSFKNGQYVLRESILNKSITIKLFFPFFSGHTAWLVGS